MHSIYEVWVVARSGISGWNCDESIYLDDIQTIARCKELNDILIAGRFEPNYEPMKLSAYLQARYQDGVYDGIYS